MTTEQWLNVAMVIAVIITAIATVLGPVLAVIVQSRISQPRPTPVENKPKSRIQRIWDWYIRLSQSPWVLPSVLVVASICLLLVMLIKIRQVTPLVVVIIACAVSLFMFAASYSIVSLVFRVVQSHLNVSRKILILIEKVFEAKTPADNDAVRQMLSEINAILNE